MFVCLGVFCVCVFYFVWGFSSHSRIFHVYGDVTFTDEGQILPLSALMSSKESLVFHTYYDTELIMRIRDTHTCY